jgi:hypothetical protein
MPLYPEVTTSEHGVQIQADASMQQNFRLQPDSSLPDDFQQTLREEHIRWDHLIIVDQVAVAGIIDTLGGLDRLSSQQAQADTIDGINAIAALMPASGSAQAALFSQANLIQRLCRTSPQSHINLSRLQDLFKTLDNHLVTDLEPEKIITDMNSMLLYGGGFTCEFPSLTLLGTASRAPAQPNQ